MPANTAFAADCVPALITLAVICTKFWQTNASPDDALFPDNTCVCELGCAPVVVGVTTCPLTTSSIIFFNLLYAAAVTTVCAGSMPDDPSANA